MKKILTASLILFALMLTACGASNQTQGGSTSQALSTQTELILGTLKLDGTANAVTKDQAATLLPLWTLMQKLQSSDSAAQEEKDAVLSQIQKTMTSDQLQAIQQMNLTMQDAVSLAQGGTQSNAKTQSGNSASSNGAPAGGPPGGGDPMMGGQMMSASSSTQTSSGQSSLSYNADQISPDLISVLLNVLQKKAGS